MAHSFVGRSRHNLKKPNLTRLEKLEKKLSHNLVEYPYKVIGIDPATFHIGIAGIECTGPGVHKIMGTERINITGAKLLDRIFTLYKIAVTKVKGYDYMIIEDQYLKNLKTFSALVMSKLVFILQYMNLGNKADNIIFLNPKEHRNINFGYGGTTKTDSKRIIVKNENLKAKGMSLDESDALSVALAGVKIIENSRVKASEKTQKPKKVSFYRGSRSRINPNRRTNI